MMSRCGVRQQIRFVQILFSLWQYVETYFAEPDTTFVFKIFYEVLGGGTRLAMPKTIYAPDSSSLKPGQGLLRESWIRGVQIAGLYLRPDSWTMKIQD